MLSKVSQTERPYTLTYMWNLKEKKKPKLIDTENRLMVVRGEGSTKWVKGVKTHKVPVIK